MKCPSVDTPVAPESPDPGLFFHIKAASPMHHSVAAFSPAADWEGVTVITFSPFKSSAKERWLTDTVLQSMSRGDGCRRLRLLFIFSFLFFFLLVSNLLRSGTTGPCSFCVIHFHPGPMPLVITRSGSPFQSSCGGFGKLGGDLTLLH